MKKIIVFIIALAISLSVNAQDYQKLWNEFDENIENLLPESAGKTLDKIEKQAKKDKNDVQLLKMVIKRCEVLSMVAEEPDDTIVNYCKSYLTKLSGPSQIILNCEIAKHTGSFNDILDYKDNDFIKTVSMENFIDIFQNGSEFNDFDIELEPTLYDYVMHCLIKHYAYFDVSKELYKKLLALDLENNFIKAYYNNRISQIGTIYDEKDFDAYTQLAAECTDIEYVAKIKIIQIEHLTYKKEYVKAKQICDETMSLLDKKHPLYKQCESFNKSITKKSIDIQMDNVCVPNQAIAVGLSYRNTTNPSYNIYKVSVNEFVEFSALEEDKLYDKLLSKKPLVKNTVSIPEETDYQEHSSLIALPALQCGQYYAVLSNNESFKNYDDLIVIAFQVSNLSYFNLETEENLNIYLVNRETSQPMSNVTARFIERSYSYDTKSWSRQTIADVVSDKNGFLVAPTTKKNAFVIDLYYKNDTLLSTSYLYRYKNHNNEEIKTKSRIFTDRAIYRPGQTVQFGCIVYRGDSKAKEVVADFATVVEFRDPNNQLIDTLHVTTNEFGMASGSFVIPQDRVNGNFRIVEKKGSTTIRVEEYKRPTFEVTFNTPEQEFKIGDSISISGKVAALSGFGLDNVKFRYEVIRKTSFPFRYWNWNPYYVDDKTIATGESVTSIDGSFIVGFQLIPSKSVPVHNIPLFRYEISIEATNKQGETQRGTFTVVATYNKYALSVETDENPSHETMEIREFKNLHVTAANINGKPVSTKVECKLFKYNDITKYDRDLGDFDRQLLSNQQLDEYFPNFDYYSKENITKDIVFQGVINVNGKAKILPENLKLTPAKYLIELKSVDDSLSVYYDEFVVYDAKSKAMPYKSMYWTNIDKTNAQPGETINYYVGSSEKNVSALVMVKHGKKILKSERIILNNNILKLSYKVTEEDRGQLDFQVAIVKHNTEMRHVDFVSVPYNNMDLNVALHTERNKILPGSTETWSLTVKDYKNKNVEVPVIATMYDASLDAFCQLDWYFNTKPAINSSSLIMTDKSFTTQSKSQYYNIYQFNIKNDLMFSGIYLIPSRYSLISHGYKNSIYYSVEERMKTDSMDFEEAAEAENADDNEQQTQENKPLKIRKDFNETAFFYPNLKTDKNGNCSFTFTMPDALTRWKLKLLAYSKDLKVGDFETTVVTQQPLMIMADMPRFVYDEDTLWIAANVINLTDNPLAPSAKLEIFDDSDNPVDLIVSEQILNMELIPAGQSRSVKWKVAMQKDLNILKFRFSAITDCFSDAEQHEMPVLSTEVYLTQTYSLTAKAHSVKEYDFDINREGERNHRITLQFNENPLWAAIHAMPYVAEGDEKYVVTAFYRYFVNTMAKQIMENHPEIAKKLENTYKNDTLSELQKYEDLKAVLLQETPWVWEAEHEAAQRVVIAKLFDTEEVNKNTESAYNILAAKQTPNGGWSWIEGCPESELITQYILTGLGQLGVRDEMSEKAFHFIENQLVEEYNKLDTKKKRNSYHCDWTTMRNLYAMSYFSYKTNSKFNTAKTFYLKKLKKDWKHFGFEKRAHIALIFNRNGDKKSAIKIVKSLREFAIKNELGMYWRNSGLMAEVRILEAFNEIDPKVDEINAMRLWILTQKRTNMWESERASVEAILALVNTGSDWTDDDNVTLTKNDDYSHITIDNQSDHVAWGGLYRQYFVPIDKVQSHNDVMKISREIIVPENVKVGDKVTVKITFENSQDMEFVYLKDLRGACFEPTEQLSSYHWDDGMWYYQSTTDVAMEYFIEYLPKGKHTVSYSVYVTKEGSFSAGYSQIQCQYAPEFGAYSNGIRVTVK